MLLVALIEIPQLYLRDGAAIGLGILAYIFWKEKAKVKNRKYTSLYYFILFKIL
jgi:hypothetical protein